MLPKTARLKSRRLFAKALNPQLGTKLGYSSLFTILGVPHQAEFLAAAAPDATLPLRFGFIVSKKVDKRATVRNKLKRQYRDIIRNHVLTNPGSRLRQFQAIVLIVKRNSLNSPFQEKRDAVLKFLSK